MGNGGANGGGNASPAGDPGPGNEGGMGAQGTGAPGPGDADAAFGSSGDPSDAAGNAAASAAANDASNDAAASAQGMADAQANSEASIGNNGQPGSIGSVFGMNISEMGIMSAIAQALGVIAGPIGLGLSAAVAMANEAQKGGQIGSNVADAMGLGSEPGGLGGPGGGGQGGGDITQGKQQIASPAPAVQRPENRTDADAARAQIRKDAAARRGRKSTLLTGGQGLLGRPNVDIKTLLGWR